MAGHDHDMTAARDTHVLLHVAPERALTGPRTVIDVHGSSAAHFADHLKYALTVGDSRSASACAAPRGITITGTGPCGTTPRRTRALPEAVRPADRGRRTLGRPKNRRPRRRHAATALRTHPGDAEPPQARPRDGPLRRPAGAERGGRHGGRPARPPEHHPMIEHRGRQLAAHLRSTTQGDPDHRPGARRRHRHECSRGGVDGDRSTHRCGPRPVSVLPTGGWASRPAHARCRATVRPPRAPTARRPIERDLHLRPGHSAGGPRTRSRT